MDIKQHKHTPVKWAFKQTWLQNITEPVSLMGDYRQTLNGGKSWTWLWLHQNTTTDKLLFLKYCF